MLDQKKPGRIRVKEGYFKVVCGIAVSGVNFAQNCGIEEKTGGIAVLSFHSAVFGIVRTLT